MLTPEYYDVLTDDLIRLYSDLDSAVIADITRRILKTGKMTESAKWQAKQLQESGLLYDDILAEIAERTDATENHVRALFEDASVESVKIDNQSYKKAGLSGIIMLSPAAMQVLNAGFVKCSGNLKNLTMTTAFTSQQAYITACNNAYMQVTSGAFDYNTAIRNAIKSAAVEGTHVFYPTGHKDRIDVAVRRAVLTGVGQTVREVSRINAVDMDCDIMEITAHSGARPSHAVWQGQLVSLSGKNAGKIIEGCRVLSLSEIGYGSGDGFGGWNCRHDWYPFFEGISKRTYSDERLKELDAKNIEYNGKKYSEYEISQIQRRYEREIRAAKREQVAFRTAVEEAKDPELKQVMQDSLNYANDVVKDKQAKMRDFIKQTGQFRDYSREQNYGRVAYPKNSGKVLTSVANSSKIELKDISSGISVNTKYFKGELKYYDITDERINKIKPVKLEVLSNENNKKLTSACKDLLSYMKDEPLGKEGVFIFDMNVNLLNTQKAVKTTAKISVQGNNVDCIVLHNHPSGLIFSEGDLRSFYEQENLKILGAVGNEGSTYFVVKAKNYDDFGFYDFLDETRQSYNIKMNEEEHLNFIQKIVEGADEYGVKFYITKN